MKKNIITMLIISALCFTISCSSKDTVNDTYTSSEDDFYQYNINSPIFTYDIDDAGNLYYVTLETLQNKTGLDADGNEISYPVSELHINVMNPDGILENTYISSTQVNDICVLDGQILFTEESLDGYNINEFDTATQASKKISSLVDYTDIIKLEAVDDKVFFIGNNKNYIDMEYTLASTEDRYSYAGERIGYIDLSAGTLEEVPIELPIAFSKGLEGNLVIYAYDEKKAIILPYMILIKKASPIKYTVIWAC